jgi:hypothetical protein
MSFPNADYQTGVWTPTLVADTTNPTVTYTLQAGGWTKIGRLVIVNARIAIATNSGGAGNGVIGGFPFPTSTSDADRGVLAVGFTQGFSSTTTPAVLWMKIDGTSKANVYRRASADARDALNLAVPVTDFLAGSLLTFTGSYWTP